MRKLCAYVHTQVRTCICQENVCELLCMYVCVCVCPPSLLPCPSPQMHALKREKESLEGHIEKLKEELETREFALLKCSDCVT